MYSVLMPRPNINLAPSVRWKTTFNSVLISSSKGGTRYGYNRSTSSGSIADGTVDILSNAHISQISYSIDIYGKSVVIELIGNHSNYGWEYFHVADFLGMRSEAVYNNSEGNTSWGWVLNESDDAVFGAENNIFLGLG